MYKKIFAASIFILFIFAGVANAHATPVSYSPLAGANLETGPQDIIIEFSERIEPLASSIKIFSESSGPVDSAEAIVSPVDPRAFSSRLNSNLQPGIYTVSWQVVSADDGHFTKGAFSFGVGQSSELSAEASFEVTHSSNWPEALSVGIELIGTAVALAVVVIILFLLRPVFARFPDLERYRVSIESRLILFLKTGLTAAVLAGLAYVIIKTTDLSGQTGEEFISALKSFTTTASAKYTLYRTGVGIAVLIWFLGFRRTIFGSKKVTTHEIIILIGLVLMDYMRARISHAAASEFMPMFSVFINFIHLLFKDLWVGSILVVVGTFAPVFRLSSDSKSKAFVLTRLSQIASVSILAAGITGAYIVWLHLKGFSNIFSTDWGVKFVILSAFGGLMFTARLYNFLIIEGGWALKLKPSLKRFLPASGFSYPFEAVIGIALLIATGFIIITTPPTHGEKLFTQMQESQGVHIMLSEVVARDGLLISFNDESTGAEISPSSIVITLTNQVEAIGPLVVEPKKNSPGSFWLTDNDFAPRGDWKIDITAVRPQAYDATAQFEVNYPDDLTGQKSAHGSFRQFDIIMIGAALLVLLGSIGLVVLSILQRRKYSSGLLALPDQSQIYLPQSWFPPVFAVVMVLYILFASHIGLVNILNQSCEMNGGHSGHNNTSHSC